MIWRHGSLPLVFWSPWDRPYEQKKGPDRFGLNAILAGTWNRYIDDWADAAREFGHPLIVSFGDEMNGDWFPWSGVYYGGGKPIGGSAKRMGGPGAFQTRLSLCGRPCPGARRAQHPVDVPDE